MVHLMAQKGAYSRMGFYLTHLSIVLIIIGALIGSFFGFKGYLNLPEGVAQKSVYLRTEPLWNKLMTNLGMAKSRVQWSFEAGMPTWPLGFMVQCDDFDADYYVNAAGMPTGMPSEYRSTLSILDLERRKILDKRITVNDPLTYRGITFYQSSYGAIPDATGYAVLNIRANNAPGSGETVVIRLGSSVRVLSIDRTIKLLGFSPFGMRDPVTGNVALYHTENNDYINPAVQLEISKGSKRLYTAEILKTDKSPPVLPEPYTISLIRYGGTRLTGLQVTKDPGVWVVYSGFILLCVGPLIAFFGSHKKLWVRIARRNNGGTVVVAGSVNKNRMGFEREFKAILSALIK
jgi:cytochrome c biogenesis protein